MRPLWSKQRRPHSDASTVLVDMPELSLTIKRSLAVQIFEKTKVLELRPGNSKFKGLKPGDKICFHWCSHERLIVEVMCEPHVYANAAEVFQSCGVETILPGRSRSEAMVPCPTHFRLSIQACMRCRPMCCPVSCCVNQHVYLRRRTTGSKQNQTK